MTVDLDWRIAADLYFPSSLTDWHELADNSIFHHLLCLECDLHPWIEISVKNWLVFTKIDKTGGD
jgi:hypothetical protein